MKIKFINLLSWAAITALVGLTAVSCSDDKTYSELLNEENQYINNFLSNFRVVDDVPADSIFETGPDAPYYRMDEDGNVYMQVLDAGTPGDTVAYNELIYFRFTRFNLATYTDGQFGSSSGNDAVLGGNYSFRFDNYQLSSTYSYGTGIQLPLHYLPVDCSVNLVIKSQAGVPDEISYVIPYLYTIRYFRPKI